MDLRQLDERGRLDRRRERDPAAELGKRRFEQRGSSLPGEDLRRVVSLAAIKHRRMYYGYFAGDIAGNMNRNFPLLATMPIVIDPVSIRSLAAVSRDASDHVSAEANGAERVRRIPFRWCLLTPAHVRKFHLKE